MPCPDTSKERLNEIAGYEDDEKRYYAIRAINDLLAMIEERDLHIRDLEDELKLYTEKGPWNTPSRTG